MPDRGGARAPLIELTLARIREFLREPEAVFWVFVFPILMACALGVAFRSRGDQAIVVGIVNAPGHEAIATALRRAGGFDPRLVESGEVQTALQRADVSLEDIDLEALAESARAQGVELETLRLNAAAEAFARGAVRVSGGQALA